MPETEQKRKLRQECVSLIKFITKTAISVQ